MIRSVNKYLSSLLGGIGSLAFTGVCLSVLLFAFVSCGGKKTDVRQESESFLSYEQQDITRKALEYVDSLITSMTLEERVGQCLMPSVQALADPASLKLLNRYIDNYHVGGVVLMSGDLAGARALSAIGSEAGLPLFMAIDAEWGLGMRLVDAPVFPKNGKMSLNTEEGEMYDYGREISMECKEIGINMVLGPVVDIVSGNGGVIGNRSYGADPRLVAELGVAYAKGLESGGVISVAKHFPGHGSASNDSHQGVAKVYRDISMLDSVDLKPFREYINSGLSAVMAGHIRVRALDPDNNAASVSMDMLTSLLREEMGFNGLVLTDAFDMGGAKGFSAWEAVRAGADIVLCPRNIDKEYQNLLEAVIANKIDVSVLNDRCRRILFYKYIFGILVS